MDGKPIFDLEKAHEGIRGVCGVMDEMELTLTERFWVLHCLVVAASETLGHSYAELKEVMEREHPELMERARENGEGRM